MDSWDRWRKERVCSGCPISVSRQGTDEIILGMTPRANNMVYVRRGICRVGSSIRDVAGIPAAVTGRISYINKGLASRIDRLNVSVIYVDMNGNLSFAPSRHNIAIGEFYSNNSNVVGYRCYDYSQKIQQ